MHVAQKMEEFSTVNEIERGREIARRRLALGIKSLREFRAATGVSRNAITAAEEGTASAGTYQRLEAWLDKYEFETGADAPDAPESVEQIEFVVEGDFGVKVTVRGPITDREQLRADVAEIVRSIRQEQAPD